MKGLFSDQMSKKNKIIFHDSISEANESQVTYASLQSPIERIRETVQLILRVYPESERKVKTNRIYIDQE